MTHGIIFGILIGKTVRDEFFVAARLSAIQNREREEPISFGPKSLIELFLTSSLRSRCSHLFLLVLQSKEFLSSSSDGYGKRKESYLLILAK